MVYLIEPDLRTKIGWMNVKFVTKRKRFDNYLIPYRYRQCLL